MNSDNRIPDDRNRHIKAQQDIKPTQGDNPINLQRQSSTLLPDIKSNPSQPYDFPAAALAAGYQQYEHATERQCGTYLLRRGLEGMSEKERNALFSELQSAGWLPEI
jgi:hypothetical protein